MKSISYTTWNDEYNSYDHLTRPAGSAVNVLFEDGSQMSFMTPNETIAERIVALVKAFIPDEFDKRHGTPPIPAEQLHTVCKQLADIAFQMAREQSEDEGRKAAEDERIMTRAEVLKRLGINISVPATHPFTAVTTA